MIVKHIEKIINGAIKKLQLDLKGLTIFTEAGTNYYVLTPIIAAKAGAKRIYAQIQDSKYGHKEDIGKELDRLIDAFEIEKNIIIKLFDKDKSKIGESDIITNLGFVRPIDKSFIDSMKKGAVIPLMYESWEFRNTDIDIKYCRKKGIPVAGTNEDDERLRILDYLIDLVELKIKEAGKSLLTDKILVFGNDKFSERIYYGLRKNNQNVDKIFDYSITLDNIKQYDVMLLTNHSEHNKVFLDNNLLDILDKNSYEGSIIQIAGGLIDATYAKELGIKVLPENNIKKGFMGWTLAQVSPKPLIDLHTAGLKVGETMARNLDPHISLQENIKTFIKQSRLCMEIKTENGH